MVPWIVEGQGRRWWWGGTGHVDTSILSFFHLMLVKALFLGLWGGGCFECFIQWLMRTNIFFKKWFLPLIVSKIVIMIYNLQRSTYSFILFLVYGQHVWWFLETLTGQSGRGFPLPHPFSVPRVQNLSNWQVDEKCFLCENGWKSEQLEKPFIVFFWAFPWWSSAINQVSPHCFVS